MRTKLLLGGLVVVAVASGLVWLLLRETDEIQSRRAASLRLLWLDQAQFAGVYAAREEGFYGRHNIDVRVTPGGPGINPILMVASGSEDFGIASGTDIILAREKGIPVRALTTIVGENPTCFFARADSGIRTVQDFTGKNVGVKLGFELEYYLDAMLRNAGVSKADVSLIPIQFDLGPFFRGEVDVWCGYRINEPNLVRARGVEVTEILPSDYGVEVVGDVLFTSEEFFEKNEQLAWDFVDGTWEGWQFARESPEKTLQHVLKYNRKGEPAHEEAMLRSVLPLVFNGRSPLPPIESVGSWAQMADFLRRAGVLKAPVEPSSCFFSR